MIREQTNPWASFQYFLAEARDWTGLLMDDAIAALSSEELLAWQRAHDLARARYPTKKQWLALKPSPGQSYVPFSFPHPRPSPRQ